MLANISPSFGVKSYTSYLYICYTRLDNFVTSSSSQVVPRASRADRPKENFFFSSSQYLRATDREPASFNYPIPCLTVKVKPTTNLDAEKPKRHAFDTVVQRQAGVSADWERQPFIFSPAVSGRQAGRPHP